MAAPAAITRKGPGVALLRWIIGLSAALAITLFAIANRQTVDVHWNPFREPLHLPLYVVTLGLMAFGFFTGSFMVWLNTLPLRFAAWKQKKQIKTLEKQLDTVHTGEPVDDAALAALPFLESRQA
jgi:uncharacterized integral membrane protein